jgi:hypothetical protein
MKTRITIAALATSAVAGIGPAASLAAGADPVATLQTDVASLQAAVSTAHDTLTADLAKIQTDATSLHGTTDRAAARATIKADLQQFRTDRQSLVPAVRTARQQVIADLKAVKAANVDPSTVKPFVKDAVKADRAARHEVLQSLRQAAHAVRLLAHSFHR